LVQTEVRSNIRVVHASIFSFDDPKGYPLFSMAIGTFRRVTKSRLAKAMEYFEVVG